MGRNGRFVVCQHCQRITTAEEWDAGSDYLGSILLCPNTRCDATEQDMRMAKTMPEAYQIAEVLGGVVAVSEDAKMLWQIIERGQN